MTTPEQQIDTGSTGSLGLEHRSFDRYYLNSPYGVLDDDHLMQRFAHLGQEAIQMQRHGVTRCVARVLVSGTVLTDILQDSHIAPLVEVAIPTGYTVSISGNTSEPVWMVMGALNHESRRSVHSVDDIVEDVERSKRRHERSPLMHVAELTAQQYTFTNTVPADRIGEVVDLWGSTFGWQHEGVEKLRERLDLEQQLDPSARAVWFSGLMDPSGRLVSVATAERLDLPLGDGRSLPIVESTEWRRASTVTRHGLMAATASHLHAQVFQDIRQDNPLIIAETNYWSGAHNVGFAAGMDVAPRHIKGTRVTQTLMQNVVVGDGITPEGLRDFTMMYISEGAREQYYNADMCAAMLQKGNI